MENNMAQIQQNGSDVTGNYFQGTSTKNKGGSVVSGGASSQELSIRSSNNASVGVFGSTVINSSVVGNTKALSSGTFSHNHVKPLTVGVTSELAGINNINAFKASNNTNKSVNKLESIITNNTAFLFRNNGFSVSTNKYVGTVIGENNSFGSDNSSNINSSISNKVAYKVGKKRPITANRVENYVSTPEISPNPTPTPSSSSSNTSPTPTPTVTLTPSVSPIGLVSTNSANYNNCAGRPSSVGTNGRSSYYGTYDMSGNIWEWLETGTDANSKVLRGGNYDYDASYIASSARNYTDKTSANDFFGFRIASSSLPSVYPNMVLVGDINNSADSSGYGAISYQYYIGRYEVTNSDYTEFLNAVAQTDSNGLYNNSMNSLSVGGITRTGSVGSYQYAAKTNMGNKPVNFVSWADCARYCNWLCNNKPSGAQTSSTTENGAYDMSQSNPSRNNNAVVFMPTENEWYKAAFYKGGSTSAGYWLYATQSNAAPNCVSVNISGDGIPV
jgi:hypothetical protein